MRNKNRIFMMILATLLCLTLISTSIVSGVFAKYVEKDAAKAAITFKKWGLEVENGTDLASSYSMIRDIDGDGEDDTFSAVSSTKNVIAPGTHGCLAWVRIKGTPEVAYDVDFTGSFSIGSGFKTSKKYILNESGTAIDYFPIGIYLVAYDVTENADNTLTLTVTDAKNTLDQSMNARACHNRSSNYIFSTYAFSSLSTVVSIINGSYTSNTKYQHVYSDNVFDSNANPANVKIDRLYTIQWVWPHSNTDTNYNYSDTKKGTYQTKEYDTQIAEAMREHPGDFKITADLDVTITQAQPS